MHLLCINANLSEKAIQQAIGCATKLLSKASTFVIPELISISS
jgi:hypothetical protein